MHSVFILKSLWPGFVGFVLVVAGLSSQSPQPELFTACVCSVNIVEQTGKIYMIRPGPAGSLCMNVNAAAAGASLRTRGIDPIALHCLWTAHPWRQHIL